MKHYVQVYFTVYQINYLCNFRTFFSITYFMFNLNLSNSVLKFHYSYKEYIQIYIFIYLTRKCPLRGHILSPPEGLHAPKLPGVNPGGRLRESGGDSKAI